MKNILVCKGFFKQSFSFCIFCHTNVMLGGRFCATSAFNSFYALFAPTVFAIFSFRSFANEFYFLIDTVILSSLSSLFFYDKQLFFLLSFYFISSYFFVYLALLLFYQDSPLQIILNFLF